MGLTYPVLWVYQYPRNGEGYSSTSFLLCRLSELIADSIKLKFMSVELIVLIISVPISIAAYFLKYVFERRRNSRRTRNILAGELVSMRKTCDDALGRNDFSLMSHSTPLWQSVASGIGYLDKQEVEFARDAIRLYMQAAQTTNSALQKKLCHDCSNATDLALKQISKN